jgi:hypothetical protein
MHVASTSVSTMVRRSLAFLACLLAIVLAHAPTRAQSCGTWVQGPERGIAGVVGVVFDALECDPDGPGPMGDVLVVAGDFSIAGDLESRFVAAWDGERWVQMGTALQYGAAYALVIHQGRLYVGGSFSGNALSNLAWWDGSRWQFVTPGPIGEVRALRSFRGELIVAGDITGIPPNLNAQGIAAWSASGWRTLGLGLDGGVTSLAILGDRLVAGGSFRSAGGQPLPGIAAWDGSRWTPLGEGGLSPTAQGASVVRALQTLGNDLYIGGAFDGVGGVPASGLARWDGAAWHAVSGDERNVVGLGIDADRLVISQTSSTKVWDGTTSREYAPIGNVYRTTSFAGQVHIGGDFRSGGGAWRWGIARREGETWEPVSPGIDNPILAILEYGGRVIAGGEFTRIGDVPANHVAAWDGTRWSAIGEGFDATVRALTTFQGQLVAAGDFTRSGSVECGRVAIWNGSAWRSAVGDEVPGSVVAVAEHAGQLALAVQFPAVGSATAWFTIYLGDEASLTPIALENPGTISRFFTHEGRLLVGGNFATIGGFASRNLAAWDGEGWGTVDDWRRGPVLCMARYQGDLVVGASFREGVWRLDSRTRLWSPVGRGLSSGATALVEYHGNLIALGGFHLAEGQIADGLAKWDGTAWRPFGAGLARQRGFAVSNGAVVYGDEVVAVGAFDRVDGIVSVNWARWRDCPADLDDGSGLGTCDGGVSMDDLFYYLELFGAGDPRADVGTREGELGRDGELTAEDVAVYLRRFAGGC